jgi:CO/xanthine dehydrogenase Mo-binding subunit
MAEPESKIALVASLDRARARLGRNMDALRTDLDVPTHLKRSFGHNKVAYVGGATLFGLAKLPARRKKIYVERKTNERVKEVEKAGIWLVVLQFLFNTFRPMLTSLAAKQLTAYVKSRGHSADD